MVGGQSLGEKGPDCACKLRVARIESRPMLQRTRISLPSWWTFLVGLIEFQAYRGCQFPSNPRKRGGPSGPGVAKVLRGSAPLVDSQAYVLTKKPRGALRFSRAAFSHKLDDWLHLNRR